MIFLVSFAYLAVGILVALMIRFWSFDKEPIPLIAWMGIILFWPLFALMMTIGYLIDKKL